jgi:hypothetical protein
MTEPYGYIHKWREPIPGCFLCIPQGDMVECDDAEWYQNLEKTVRESVERERDKISRMG